MTDELGTVYAALRTALIATMDSTPSWGTSAFADFVPVSASGAAISRPYVVYSFGGGGDLNNIIRDDPNLLIDVLCVADTLAAALTGAADIRARLNNRGEMDAMHAVGGDSTWMIKTIDFETRLHFIEEVQGATQIYHSGGRFRVGLEKRQ